MVWQCLDKQCLMSPDALLTKLKATLNSPSALLKTTVVTAMKFTISDQPKPIDQLLRAEIGHFLILTILKGP
jgi:cullin-associated NEDD8-dissociated protein 1